MATVFATVSTPGPSGPPGPAGYSPKYIVAAGVPPSGTGNNGDMYIDSTTSNVYGPKAAGAWGAVVCNIKGATGATGATGAPGYSPQYIVAAGAPGSGTGNNGDMYINSATSDVYGPKAAGVWGAIQCNIKGATGAAGPPGVAYTPRGAWSAATTYAQGDEATDASVLYISLQSGNLNHVPASSPTWWQPVGSGGSQTPWLTNINGGGFQLTNVAAIGIGNNLPGSPLTIIQPSNPTTVAAATQIAIGENTNNTNYRLTLGYAIVGGAGVGAIQVTQGGTQSTLYLNNAGGNVGIGLGTSLTAAPLSRLHVSNGPVTIGDGNAGSSNTGGKIVFRVDFGSADTVGGAAIQGLNQWGGDSNGQAMDLGFYTNQHTGGNTYSGLLERMRITQAGNVGIGISNPLSALSVIIPVNPNSVATANQITIGETTNNSGYRLSIGYASITGTGASQGVIQATAGGAGAALLLNPSGGKVGIFTNIPGYALDVNGDINCSGAFRVGGVALATPAAGIGLFAAATSGGVTISTVSQVDVPGMALTLARAGRYAITVNLYLTNDGSGGSQGCEGVLIVNGVQDSRYLSNNATYLFSAMQTQQWMLVVAASTPIKVQIAKLNGSGNVNVGGLVSTMTAVWIADS